MIKAGDLVQVISVYCPAGCGAGYVGHIYTVHRVFAASCWCTGCLQAQGVIHVADTEGGIYALSVLKKIPPLTKDEKEEESHNVPATVS